MSPLNYLPPPSVKQWEEAGTSLVGTLKTYLDMCLNLGTESLREGANAKDLASRIDFTLGTIHTTISRQLAESNLALVRTRNKFASPLFQFPEELLSEIFMNVVYGRNNSEVAGPLSMEQDVKAVYRHVYTLLHVCSVWRDIVLTRSALWSLIPILWGSPSCDSQCLQLRLQRAGRSPLHLAALTGWSGFGGADGRLLEVLAEYGPRFRTINLNTDHSATIGKAIDQLLQHNTTSELSELSIRLSDPPAERLPEDFEYVFPRDSPRKTSFANLVGSLTAFRISGAPFHWDSVVFSTRLVELRIDNLVLGYDTAIAPFVQTLSSASELRDLRIISLKTFHNPSITDNTLDFPPVVFPNLRLLLLQDLYFNTLQFLLPMIAPGSYSLTLFLRRKSLRINIQTDFHHDFQVMNPGFDALCRVLEHASVRTLLIGGRLDGVWLTGSELHKLLRVMPALKTLMMDNWKFGTSVWTNLKQSRNPHIHPHGHSFPSLENLYLSSSKIFSTKGLVGVAASHPLQLMVLGATIPQIRQGETSLWEPLPEGSHVVRQLRTNVPTFRLVHNDYIPPEFYSDRWRLW